MRRSSVTIFNKVWRQSVCQKTEKEQMQTTQDTSNHHRYFVITVLLTAPTTFIMIIRFSSIALLCSLSIALCGGLFVNSPSFVQRRTSTSAQQATFIIGGHSSINFRNRISQTQLGGSKWDNLVDEDDEDEFEPQVCFLLDAGIFGEVSPMHYATCVQ